MDSTLKAYHKHHACDLGLEGRTCRPYPGGWKMAVLCLLIACVWSFSQSRILAATATNAGLWVGEVALDKVNESVGGINAANQLVFHDPSDPTPTASAAHLRVILHVDSQGQVRLLKNVAILSKTNNQTVSFALVTDPALYPNYSSSSVGQRIAAAAFDFGDPNGSNALFSVAAAAANAAASPGDDPTNAANQAMQAATTNGMNPSPGYSNFVASATFLSSAGIAAAAASAAAVQASGASFTDKRNAAQGAALKALADGQVFAAADGVVANEVKLAGSLAPGTNLMGSIYMGAGHPTNPFRHRRHPDHMTGYTITRQINIQFDTPSSTNAVLVSGMGVEKISGTYTEEIKGLHKPLGQNQTTGLITQGTILLNRISQVDTLNQ